MQQKFTERKRDKKLNTNVKEISNKFLVETKVYTGDGNNFYYLDTPADGYNLIAVANGDWASCQFEVGGIFNHNGRYGVFCNVAIASGVSFRLNTLWFKW